jgi:hypothetical protein
MGLQLTQLPRRLPAGTRLVIEGRNGHIHLRCLEFPDGRTLALPTELAPRDHTKGNSKSAAKKKMSPAGTTRHLAS